MHRTLDAKEAVDTFLETRQKHLESPAIFHARISTHGTNTVENCHPFVVGGDKRVVLAHNGILPCEPGPFDDRSDTRYFAEEVLPANGGIQSLIEHRQEWEHWMGWQNKVVVIASTSTGGDMAILNRHQGYWNDGLWWSNRSYMPVSQRWSGSYTYKAPKGDTRWPKCDICEQACENVTTVEDTDLCLDCLRTFAPEAYWPTSPLQPCDGCDDMLPRVALSQHKGELLCLACHPTYWDQDTRRAASTFGIAL